MPNPTFAFNGKAWQSLGLLVLIVAGAANVLGMGRKPGLYNAATLAFNYVEFGAVRRGLGGTIAYFLSDEILVAAWRFQLVSALAFAAAALMLHRRLVATPAHRLASAIVLVGIAFQWSNDVGRTDVMVAALLAWATLATQRARLDWAALAIGVGLFVHETSFIFGLPLLCSLVLLRGKRTPFPPAVTYRALALLAVALGVYLAMRYLPHADHETIVQTIRAKADPHEHVDWAIFFALSGARGVVMSMCQNLTDPSYWTHPASGFIVLALVYTVTTSHLTKHLPWAALSALLPFAFLCIVANDISRWTMLAAVNLWLFGASSQHDCDGSDVPPGWSLAAACLLPLLVLPQPFTVEAVYAGSTTLEWAFHKIGVPRTPGVDQAFVRCDPNWRQVLESTEPKPSRLQR